MADEVKRVQVRIGSITYSLVSAEDEQYTRKVGTRADEMIQRVMQSNPQLSQQQATVLALVNAVDDLTRAYEKVRSEDNRQQQTDRQISEIRHELQRQREHNWEMKKEILALRQVCSEYEAELAKWRRSGKYLSDTDASDMPLQVSDVTWQEHEQDPTAPSADRAVQQAELSPEALEAAEPERKRANEAMPGKTPDRRLKPDAEGPDSSQDEANEDTKSGSQPDTHQDQANGNTINDRQPDTHQDANEDIFKNSQEADSLKQTHFDDYLNQGRKDGR